MGTLSISQKQGIITCIPKPNKSRESLKNWRPISLLNVIYKMCSGVIANRIKSVLNQLIHEDQKGFIPGRFIGENIRLVYDVLFEAKKQNIPGLLLSIDFEKAFDTVSWNFIHRTLEFFNFGSSLKKWISIFQTDIQSSILQNGFMSDFFYLKRGCRQGDPISPYIFLLCAEVLGQMIRKNRNIKGILINDKEFKLTQYADDTQIFLNGSEESLRHTLNILNEFYQMSGLKINVDKTKAVWFGACSHSELTLCNDFNLDWDQGNFKLLGVTFSPELFDLWDLNSANILKKIKENLHQWSKRKLTLKGRITVIKSLVLSKFVHLFISLPDPPLILLKELEKIFFKFIWNSGPDRIKRNILIKNLDAGGQRMVHLYSFIKALKISWLRKVLHQNDNAAWIYISSVNFKKLFTLGGLYASQQSLNMINPFWKDVLQHWSYFCKALKIESIQQVLNSPIWFNSKFINHNIYFESWYKKGIISVYDLIDNNGNFYEFQSLKKLYDIRGTFLDYQRVINSIPNDWKTMINDNKIYAKENKSNVRCNAYMSTIMKAKKGSRIFYDILTNVNEVNINKKWVTELGEINENEWRKINNSITRLRETKLQDFQYKLNNKILVTNYFLWKIGKIDCNLCSFCKVHPETLTHLFLECNHVKIFLNDLTIWMKNNINIELSRISKDIIFSYQGNSIMCNYIHVLAKYYIYRTKFSEKNLSVRAFTSLLYRKCVSEKYNAFIFNRVDSFFHKWSNVYNYFAALNN